MDIVFVLAICICFIALSSYKCANVLMYNKLSIFSAHANRTGRAGMLQFPSIGQYHFVEARNCAFSAAASSLWNSITQRSYWPFVKQRNKTNFTVQFTVKIKKKSYLKNPANFCDLQEMCIAFCFVQKSFKNVKVDIVILYCSLRFLSSSFAPFYLLCIDHEMYQNTLRWLVFL